MSRDQGKIKRSVRSVLKRGYQSLRVGSTAERRICLILGCQRSGTTLMVQMLDNDMRLRVFPELSEVTYASFRLRPYSEVRSILSKSRAPVIIMKPLVESQHATRLLSEFEGAKVIWAYRRFQDVASSMVKKFGAESVINDIRFVKDSDASRWIGERVPEHCRQLVTQYYAEDMNPHTAASLSWYVRNQLFFEQGLEKEDRVLLCRYEDLVQHPSSVARKLYNHIGIAYPGDRIVSEVDSTSLGKGAHIEIPEALSAECQELYQRLNSAEMTGQT